MAQMVDVVATASTICAISINLVHWLLYVTGTSIYARMRDEVSNELEIIPISRSALYLPVLVR